MKRAKIICVCKEAKSNCYLLCARGRRIEPDKVYQYDRWPKEKNT